MKERVLYEKIDLTFDIKNNISIIKIYYFLFIFVTYNTEIPEKQLTNPSHIETWLDTLSWESKLLVNDLLNSWEVISKKSFIFNLKKLLKDSICKNSKNNSLVAFIDKYILWEIISSKIQLASPKFRYKINSLRKNQLVHASNFNLYKLNHDAAKYIEKQITLKDIEILQSNLIIHINRLASFLKKFSAYVWDDIFGDKKQFVLDENTFTLNGMELLFEAYYVIYSHKKINGELLEHIKKIMELVYLLHKVLVHINLSTFLIEINWIVKPNVNQQKRLIGLFALMRYLINKEKELAKESLEKNFLLNISWLKTVNIDRVKYFWSSIFIDDLKSIEKTKRNKIIWIILIWPKFLLNLKNADNALYNYIKKSNLEHLDKIFTFFENAKIEFTQEQYLYIFENDLFESRLVSNKDWLEKSKKMYDNWIEIEKIKTLNCEQLDVLFLEEEIEKVKFLVESFLEFDNNHELYLLYLEENKNLKESLKHIHKNANWYEELSFLSNLKYEEINDIREYINKINWLFLDNDLYKVLDRNKRYLSWENNSIDELDELYIILNWLEDKILWKLLSKIYRLSRQDFVYIKEVFTKFKWWKNDYKYFLDKESISKILKNKDLIDLYINDKWEYSLAEIISDIEDETFRQNNKSKEVVKYENLEISEEELYLKTRFQNKEEFEMSKKIIDNLNWYRKDFVSWVKKKKNINYLQLKNIYDLMNFFISRDVKSFTNLKEFFNLAYNLWDENKCIDFIHNIFRNINDFKDINELKKVIKSFLETRNEMLLLNYHNRITKLNWIVVNNNIDIYLAKIFEDWNQVEINNIWEEISQIISHIFELLHPSFLTSTKHNDSWKWTWKSSYTIRKIYIEPLLKNDKESLEEYFNRIILINWRDISISIIPDEINRKSYKMAQNCALDQDFMFFEALEQLSKIIQRYQDENNKLEIWKLQNTYDNLLKDIKKSLLKKSIVE